MLESAKRKRQKEKLEKEAELKKQQEIEYQQKQIPTPPTDVKESAVTNKPVDSLTDEKPTDQNTLTPPSKSKEISGEERKEAEYVKTDDKRGSDNKQSGDKKREERSYRSNKDSSRKSEKYSSSGGSRSSRSSESTTSSKKKIDDSKNNSSSEKKEEASAPSSITDIENEMKKRKERIEAWRNSRKKVETKTEATEETKEPTKSKITTIITATKPIAAKKNVDQKKKWSLGDDSDEDDEATKNGTKSKGPKSKDVEMKEEEDDEDLDPLDAFMKTIEKEVKKNGPKSTIKKAAPGDSKGSNKTITVVKTVVKKKEPEADPHKKPEVMEQNQDALEYSSEEETPADVTATDFADAKKKKEVVVDHSRIYYAPFRRDFYVEVPELAKMTPDEVKLYRELLGDIQVRGKNVPKPIKSWAQAGLNAKVMNVLKKCNYEKPTPIQAQAIPAVMSGRDMIGIAKTGSGKTLAFLLPMLRHVLDQPALEEDDGPIAIIMTPTRELALQIFREGKKFCRPLQLSIACIYGGSGISEQIAELKRGAEIIVCTPGRMIDMLAANNGRVTNCRRCTYLVMDEADRMFDMGFEPQVKSNSPLQLNYYIFFYFT